MDHRKLQAEVNDRLKKDALVSLMRTEEKSVEGLSSGSLLLNLRLTGKPDVGYVEGRVVELYGPESSGKTTLALHAVLEAQRRERDTGKPFPVCYIDAENGLDKDYMANIGIDLDNLSVAQPDSGEDAFEIILESVRQNSYRLIVVDSVAALVPMAEVEGDMGDSHMGLHARMMSQGLRKLTGTGGPLVKSSSIVIFINQIRSKVGVVFGNPETTPGGWALRFYSTHRIEVRSPAGGKIVEKNLNKDSRETGRVTNVKIVKNKVSPPHQACTFTIKYGKGLDRTLDLIQAMDELGVMSYQGRNLKQIESDIRKAPELLEEIITALETSEKGRRKAAVK
jgi:recombination protein RecA